MGCMHVCAHAWGVHASMYTCVEARSSQEASLIFHPPYSLRQRLSRSQPNPELTDMPSLLFTQLTQEGLTQGLSRPLDIYPHVFCWRRRWDESGRQALDFQSGFVGCSETKAHGLIHHPFSPVWLPSALGPAHQQDKLNVTHSPFQLPCPLIYCFPPLEEQVPLLRRHLPRW